MNCLHAAWILPIARRPIKNGWVGVDQGRVVAVGERQVRVSGIRHELGEVAVLPGLVNAHTHLELSYLRGVVPPQRRFTDWVRTVIALRRRSSNPAAPEILDAIERGIDEALGAGTAVVGDISNTLASAQPLGRSRLAAVVFLELIGFRTAEPRAVVDRACRDLEALAPTPGRRVGLAAHAPYSVGPSLLRSIRDAVDRDPRAVCSVHLAESAEETEFIQTAGGPWRALLTELGAWDPEWVPPGVSPVRYLDEAGFLDERVVAVHGVQASDDDLERLAVRGVTLVTCPRSNEYTGAGRPPIGRFYASGVPVAIGTDSLASAPDLNLFAELAALRALAPEVPAAALLESATRVGARALGFDPDYGVIAPGVRARLIAVDVPAGIGDVEEYLVSGIRPDQVRWVGDT